MSRMKVISSTEVDKIEGKCSDWFFLEKVIVQPNQNSDEVMEWWKVFHAAHDGLPRSFVSHAPTQELAMEQIKSLQKNSIYGMGKLGFKFPDPIAAEKAAAKAEKEKIEAEQKKIAAEKEKKRIEKKKARARAKRLKERQAIEKMNRFTGLEI